MLNYLLIKYKEYIKTIETINTRIQQEILMTIINEKDSKVYLERLLEKYSAFFDIKKEYDYHGIKFSAYAYFHSLNEKYVLTRKANLWRAKAFEHVLFLEVDRVDTDLIEKMRKLIKEHMEPELVREGNKYPCEDHMYSYLTLVILSKEKIENDMIRAVRRFHFDKGYLFSFRGHSEAHIACVDMESELVYTNFAAREMKKTLQSVFEEKKIEAVPQRGI